MEKEQLLKEVGITDATETTEEVGITGVTETTERSAFLPDESPVDDQSAGVWSIRNASMDEDGEVNDAAAAAAAAAAAVLPDKKKAGDTDGLVAVGAEGDDEVGQISI